MAARCLLLCELSSSYFFFFFKQKTAYEMRISDWSSDVCSSDLADHRPGDMPRRRLPDVLRARRLADRPCLAVQSWRDHHRAHHILLSLRDDGRPVAAGKVQPRAGGSCAGSRRDRIDAKDVGWGKSV